MLLMGLEKGLLEQSVGLGKGLQCGIGIQLVDERWLFVGQLVAELQLDVAWHCSAVMWLCFACFAGSCGEWSVLSLLVEGPVMGKS